MANIVDDLLKTYYGFGRENEKATKVLPNYENVIDRPNIFKKSIATEYIVDSSDENAGDKQCSAEANVSDDQTNNDTEEKHIRSWRAIVNDGDINDDDIYVNNEELILDSKEINNDNFINNDAIMGIKVIPQSSRKEDVHDEPATVGQTSLGILDVLVQENVSNVSLSSKKKLKKKSRSTTLTQNSSLQLYPLQCNSLKQIEFNCDGEFSDMSNVSITQFPINLLDKLRNIKILYLENNALVHLPEELFTKLNFLQWLDVRHNRLITLPSTIKYHSSLETILLQENRIERLPLELGVVPNLEAVQLQGNPLIYPPPDILAQGFKEIIKFLRKQWNVEHPDEAVYIPEETKSKSITFNHKPSTVKKCLRSTKMPTVTKSSSIILPKLKQTNLSIREKTWSYKPSNRYEKLNPAEYNLIYLNDCENELNDKLNDILCENCYNKYRKNDFSSNNTDDDSIIYQQMIINMKEKENITKKHSESSQMSMSTKKDAEILVKLDINNYKNSNANVKLPKIKKTTLAEEIKRMEDIKVKERVYSIITNDRIMTKLRPMRLKDPDWTLAFIENYLNIANRPLEYSTLKSAGHYERNAIMEAKLQWIAKVKEKLNKQTAILQRVKDKDVLKKWRQDRRTFDQSIKKAVNRTSDDIPYGVDYTDIPYLKQQNQSQNEKQMYSPKKDINSRMSEISTSLKKLEIDKRSGKLDVKTELKRLEVEIKKLSNLQQQIHSLNIENETAMSKYKDVNSKNIEKNYLAPPSIII
ncbi:hypothetical protein PV326_008950 [Microctonus aethiopoides]|nr:hypothetical protein PV326_008950 [Microctonus aethiopoides]